MCIRDRFNPAFGFDREEAFVEWLLDGQPEAPKYFAQMKKVNKLGPSLTTVLPMPVNFCLLYTSRCV